MHSLPKHSELYFLQKVSTIDRVDVLFAMAAIPLGISLVVQTSSETWCVERDERKCGPHQQPARFLQYGWFPRWLAEAAEVGEVMIKRKCMTSKQSSPIGKMFCLGGWSLPCSVHCPAVQRRRRNRKLSR